MESFPLSPAETDRLEQILFEVIGDDAPDLFGLHGLLTALLIYPGINTPEQIPVELITGDETSLARAIRQELTEYAFKLARHIAESLDSEGDFPLPSEVNDDEDACQSWCAGFMEGVLAQEAQWFATNREERCASLLLPIMVCSGLYDDPEIQQMQQDERLMLSLLEQIPEVVIDLYLMMNAE